MVALASSSFALDHPQEDGRCWVVESMTASDGRVRESRYLAEADEDHTAHLAATASGWIDHLNLPQDPE